MATDASIYGNVQPPRRLDPLGIQQQVLTLQSLRDQQALNVLTQRLRGVQVEESELGLNKTRRDLDEDRAVRELFSGAVNPDGTVNRSAVITGAASRGIGNRIPKIEQDFAAIDKSRVDAKKTQADLDKVQLETNLKRVDARAAALTSLLNAPDLSHQKVIDTLAGMVQDGIISAADGFNATRQLPGRIEHLRPYLQQQALRVMGAKERLEMQLPKYEMKDTGKQMVPVDMNSLTNPMPQTLQKTTTPGEDLSASTQRRGQDMTDRRERALAERSVTYVQGEDGSYAALPTKVAPGTVVRPQPVIANDGMRPFVGKLSESQSKAIMDINRMRAIVDGGLKAVQNNKTAFSFGRGAAQVLPGGESIAGRFDKPEEIQARSYVFNVVSGVINERAGAAQSAQELQRLRSFLPGETDNAMQIEEKLKGFITYLEDLERGTKEPRTRGNPAADIAAPAPAPALNLPPDVVDILRINGVTQ